MAIKSAPYYWIECDRCGSRCPPEEYEVTAWGDEESALLCAVESGWMVDDDRHLCPECAAAQEAEEEARGEPS